jgi:hypothetical protein
MFNCAFWNICNGRWLSSLGRFVNILVEFGTVVQLPMPADLSNFNLKLLESSHVCVWQLMQVCLLYMQKPGREKLNTRRKIRKLSLLYNIVNGDTPDYLSDLLSRTFNQANNYNLRNANNFTIPRCRLTLYQNSFFPATIHLWNNLPQYIRDSPSNCILKSRLKTYYNNPLKSS